MTSAPAPSPQARPPLRLRRRLRLVRDAVRLVWEASPPETVRALGFRALAGLAPAAHVVAGKMVIDAVLAGEGLRRALPAVGAFFAVMLGSRLVFLGGFRERLLSELVRRAAEERLLAKTLSLDLAVLERPSYHNLLARARREAGFRPMNMVSDIAQMTTQVVAVAGLVSVIGLLQPLIALLVLVAYVPLWMAAARGAQSYYRFMTRNTPRDRLLGYLAHLLTSIDSAKEMRAFGLRDYLLGRYRRAFRERFAELQEFTREQVRRQALAGAASGTLGSLALLLVVVAHLEGGMGLSESAAAAGALLLLGTRLTNLVQAAGHFYENVVFLEDLEAFMALRPAQVTLPGDGPVPDSFEEISVEDVSFTYPEAPAPALCGVSLRIRRGETVALVGENGAGKTTIAKLLCRLYDPDRGRVAWDGRDLRTCDPQELRGRIAVIFQDFVRYELTARENVGLGDVGCVEDLSLVEEAARRAGAHEDLARLPEGYETMLGRMFDEGVQLSTGQWQRVALARAFVREAPLVIMDEPTASLDARSEYELFRAMRELFEGRAVVLISHRFSSVRMADRIYVLREGRVVEEGSHGELVALGGLYAELFALQASAYVDPDPAGAGG